MRSILLATAATMAFVSAISLAPNRAQALPLAAPAGVQAAIDDAGLVQEATYGYGHRRSYGGHWAPRYRYLPYSYYYQPYGYYQPYSYYRPFHRPYRYW